MLSLSISCLALLIHITENVNASFQNNEEMKLASGKLSTFSLPEDCRLEKNVWFWYVKCNWQLLLFLYFLSTFYSCLVVILLPLPLPTSALSVYSQSYHCKIEFSFTMEVVGTQPALKGEKTLFNLFRTALQTKTRRKWLIKMKLPAADLCTEFTFLFLLKDTVWKFLSVYQLKFFSSTRIYLNSHLPA